MALPRACYGLAALMLAQTVLIVSARHETAGRPLLVSVHLGIGLVLSLIGWLAATRRLPGWRREGVIAVAIIATMLAAGLRSGLAHSPGQLAELPVLAVLAASLLTRPAWWLVAVVTGPGVFASAMFVSLLQPRIDTQSWLHTGLALAAGIVVAWYLHAGRRTWAQALADSSAMVSEQTVHDQLTGIVNRKGLELAAVPMIEHAKRDGMAVHCLVLDIDGIRSVNEALGHRAGDELIMAVAEALTTTSRTTDVVARWGDDQFILLGPGTGTSPLELERRIRVQLASSPPVPESVWAGRMSVGAATLVPWDDGGLDSLLSRAESDMSLRRSLRRKADAARESTEGAPSATGGSRRTD